jgi:hypothetical protein
VRVPRHRFLRLRLPTGRMPRYVQQCFALPGAVRRPLYVRLPRYVGLLVVVRGWVRDELLPRERL